MPSLLAESYLHRLDPFAIQLTETFGLRWYGLSYAFGFLVAWAIMRWLGRTGRSPLKPDWAGDFMFYIIAGVLIGGRLGYVLLYDPSLLTAFGQRVPFWGVLAINRGGMASHGGILGAMLACVVFARRRGVPFLHLIDLVAFSCPIGLGAGRLANFVNGELWGEPLPPPGQVDPPAWSVKYPDEVMFASFELPAPVEAALRAEVGGDAMFRANVADALRDGNAAVTELVQPLLTAYYPSQLFQALAEGPILLAILALVWLRPRKSGLIGSSFLIGYGVLRILTEIFRQPDEGVTGIVTNTLSRGQELSALMILGGVAMAIWCARRSGDRIGGLLRVPVTNDRDDSGAAKAQ